MRACVCKATMFLQRESIARRALHLQLAAAAAAFQEGQKVASIKFNQVKKLFIYTHGTFSAEFSVKWKSSEFIVPSKHC